MCHTEIEGNTAFIFNPDFSGKMRIRNRETGEKVDIPVNDLIEFITDYQYDIKELVNPPRMEGEY
jgi:hypothetical protein